MSTPMQPAFPPVEPTTKTTPVGGDAATTDPIAKAKDVLTQVGSVVSSTISQLTHTIEEKTTTDSHPGLITQVQNAVAKGTEKINNLLDSQVVPPNTVIGGAQTIPTTTNTVPHFNNVSDPVAPPSGASGASGSAAFETLPAGSSSASGTAAPGSSFTTTPAQPQ